MFLPVPGVSDWKSGGVRHLVGPYLTLCYRNDQLTKDNCYELRALVRNVKLSQRGWLMEGNLAIEIPAYDPVEIALSVEPGSTGLPLPAGDQPGLVPLRLWNLLHPVPVELTACYWKSDPELGRQAVLHWAMDNQLKLRRLVQADDHSRQVAQPPGAATAVPD